MNRSYYTYILTNPNKTTLYTGVTNNITRRILEHYSNRGKKETFAGRFYCYHLVFVEEFKYVNDAIWFEKHIKRHSRKWKIDLIKSVNPKMLSLNSSLIGEWPPSEQFIREVLGSKD
jgi:putative endonuclease